MASARAKLRMGEQFKGEGCDAMLASLDADLGLRSARGAASSDCGFPSVGVCQPL